MASFKILALTLTLVVVVASAADDFEKAMIVPLTGNSLMEDGEALLVPLSTESAEDRSAYIITLCNQDGQCPAGYKCRKVDEISMCFQI
eukprot:maker-scaffold522_size146686-snap-gene-0.20 protein:Tk03525 transcript:maker-scaffold522_size146686-snap-gene-0.20-mRNA-1 annotation:"rna-binding protein"